MTQKKRFTNKLRRLRSNRGSAIVCAIGVLAAILIIVMLFASKAKVSSNISTIRLDNQTAKTLAKSLIPRIALTINESKNVQDLILYSSIYDHNDNTLNKTYRSENLYTYDWIWKLEHPAHFKFTPTKRNLVGKIEEMGTFAFYGDSSSNGPEFDDGKPFVPTWQYILDIPKPDDSQDNKRGAVARFAFVIIPEVAHLNPNAIVDHTHCQKLSGTSVKVTNHGYCNKCARKLGNSPAELMFGHPEGAADNGDLRNLGDGYIQFHHMGKEFEENNMNKWQTTEMFCYSFGIIPPSLSADAKTIDKYISDKNTVTRFMDVDNTGDREAYWSDDGYKKDGELIGKNDKVRNPLEYYHRFNMRRTDWENLKVEDIIAAPKVWNDPTDLQEPAISGEGNRNNFDTGGIAWLRNWKDPGDWENAEKTKKQVVANLLNYCSPPTRPVVSNVESKNWNKVEDDGDENFEPEYTGLKRTLYLNEYFYDVRFKSKVDADYNDAADETKIKVTYNFETEFMVELVDMYLNTLGDNNNHPVKFEKTMKEPDFSTYYPEIYGTLTFKYKVKGGTDKDDEGAYATMEYKIHKDLNGLKFTRFEKDEGASDLYPHIKNKKSGYYGYYAKKDIDDAKTPEERKMFEVVVDDYATIDGDATTTFLKADGGHKTMWPAIKGITLKIDKILLYRTPTKAERDYREGRATDKRDNTFPFDRTEKGETPDGEDFKEYVDCARISQKYNNDKAEFAEENKPKIQMKLQEDSKDAFVAFCGGREAYDPRQNLRLCDWSGYKTNIPNSKTWNVYTTEEDWSKKRKNLHTLPIQTSSGGFVSDINPVNKVVREGQSGSPKIKKKNDSPHDCEATDDPGWALENGIKKAPTAFDTHISTAFIRHAILRRTSSSGSGGTPSVVEHPMESLWELGAIHRGSRWQTLNLSKSPEYDKAEGFVNDGAGDYENGDGPILDQVKMTNDCLSFGKINLVRHLDQEVRNTVVGSLFRDMPIHKYGFYLSQGLDEATGIEDLDLFPNKDHEKTWTRIYDKNDPNSGRSSPTVKADTSLDEYSHFAYVIALYDVLFGDGGNTEPLKRAEVDKNKFWRRTDFLAAPKTEGAAQDNTVKSDILFPIRQQSDSYITDAMEEQIIGRTINLMKIEETSIKGATAILLVQTLKDSGNNTMVYKDWNGDGKITADLKASDKDRKNEITQLQSGYRRFTEREKGKKPFFLPPDTNAERIQTGNRGLGTYQNGADTITGEVKVIITLDYDAAKQKWNLVKYEYAE